MTTSDWTPAEPEEVLDTFREMLRAATGDGAKKRQSGEKPSWKVDPGHETAIFSHLHEWKNGTMEDKDSRAHPLVHAAWRCLAIAYQETNGTVYTHKHRKAPRPALAGPTIQWERGAVPGVYGPDHPYQ